MNEILTLTEGDIILDIVTDNRLGREDTSIRKSRTNSVRYLTKLNTRKNTVVNTSMMQLMLTDASSFDRVYFQILENQNLSGVVETVDKNFTSVSFTSSLLIRADNLIGKGELDQAIFFVLKEINKKIKSSEFNLINELLQKAVVNNLNLSITLSILTITADWSEYLPHRKIFFNEVSKYLISSKGKREASSILNGLD